MDVNGVLWIRGATAPIPPNLVPFVSIGVYSKFIKRCQQSYYSHIKAKKY